MTYFCCKIKVKAKSVFTKDLCQALFSNKKIRPTAMFIVIPYDTHRWNSNYCPATCSYHLIKTHNKKKVTIYSFFLIDMLIFFYQLSIFFLENFFSSVVFNFLVVHYYSPIIRSYIYNFILAESFLLKMFGFRSTEYPSLSSRRSTICKCTIYNIT